MNSEVSEPDTAIWLPVGIPRRIGQYELIRPLGKGGSGAVFEARHQLLHQRVAIKILHPLLASNPQFVIRFFREMAAFGRIAAHPNLIRAQNAGEEAGLLYLVLDYADGADLGVVLDSLGPFPVAAACDAIRQAALGLEVVHRAGFVHRDLKPANLFLDVDGVVKILDLGIARLHETEGEHDEITHSNVLMGTFDYQSPEQAADPRRVDIRADIYSLGCSLYKLVTERAPFPYGASVREKIQAHACNPFPQLGQTAGELNAILGRMTAKDPNDRYSSPAELAEALSPLSSHAALLAMARGVNDVGVRSEQTHIAIERSAVTPTDIRPTRVAERSRDLRSRYRRIAVFGLVFIVACSLLIFNFGLRPSHVVPSRDLPTRGTGIGEATTKPTGDPILSATPRVLDGLPTNEMHDLLTQPPVQIFWEHGNGIPTRSYDAGLRQLSVSTPHAAMFELGQLQRPSFEWQVTISQASWSKGSGIYFGFKPSPSPAKTSVFQYLLFTAESTVGGKRSLTLTRGRGKLVTNEVGTAISLDGDTSDDVDAPIQEGVLCVEVQKWKMSRIRFNGVEFKKLILPNRLSKEDEYRGGLGLLTESNSCVYRKTYLTPFRDP